MEETKNFNIDYSGRVIAKNTLFNLLGNFTPILFALVFIPPLIKGLGIERFGILSIAWMITGYFSLLDFGIGKGLTKVVAEKIGLNQTDEISKIFWTSLFLMLVVSFFASIILFFFIPFLVDVFNISKNLKEETKNTFYILLFSIPIVTTMAGLRGSLEAYQKFATINIIKAVLGIFTYLGPLLVFMITNSLFWIVVFLISTRVIIWILYLIQCFTVNERIRKGIQIDFKSIQPVLKFSIWITLANIVVPIIQYSDRFLIAVLISAAAITYYVTPYDVISKLILIPDAIMGVLFPLFSSSFLSKPDITKKLFLTGAKIIFLILYPVVFLITIFSFEGINLWLGESFAQNSYFILQLLAIGVMMNCISLIPTNFFQGMGKPNIPSIIVLIELPVYVFSMWFAIIHFGINGAAMVFMIATTINVSILYLIANKKYSIKFESGIKGYSFIFLLIGLIFPFFVKSILLKILLSSCIITIFPILLWKFLLSYEEKLFIVSKLKLNSKLLH